MTGKADLAASVAARLLNRARERGEDYQTLLSSYCFERFLYRLGRSALRDRFVLKGAMLLGVWSDRPYRATRDLDLLRRGDGSFEAIRRDLATICAVRVDPDAVEFDAAGVRIESIRAEDEYAGTRASLPARCGSARLVLQVDMGLGDSVWPEPQRCAYPALLGFPAPEVLAYPREAVVAEKLEAMVMLGDRNSRIKDFFDLHHLANRFEFDRATLAEAVRRTFEQRRTPFPAKLRSGSPRSIGRTRRDRRRCARSPGERGSKRLPRPAKALSTCSARSCCRSLRICGRARAAWVRGLPEVHGSSHCERRDPAGLGAAGALHSDSKIRP
jgi:hypothetical protein